MTSAPKTDAITFTAAQEHSTRRTCESLALRFSMLSVGDRLKHTKAADKRSVLIQAEALSDLMIFARRMSADDKRGFAGYLQEKLNDEELGIFLELQERIQVQR